MQHTPKKKRYLRWNCYAWDTVTIFFLRCGEEYCSKDAIPGPSSERDFCYALKGYFFSYEKVIKKLRATLCCCEPEINNRHLWQNSCLSVYGGKKTQKQTHTQSKTKPTKQKKNTTKPGLNRRALWITETDLRSVWFHEMFNVVMDYCLKIIRGGERRWDRTHHPKQINLSLKTMTKLPNAAIDAALFLI